MLKKLNKDAVMIKTLLAKGLRQCEIVGLLGFKKEKVSYWSRTELKESQHKPKKLNEKYIKTIQRWALNKTTSQRSSRKIAAMINSILVKRKEFDSKGHQITIHYTTVNNYLREYYGKPRKIRKQKKIIETKNGFKTLAYKLPKWIQTAIEITKNNKF